MSKEPSAAEDVAASLTPSGSSSDPQSGSPRGGPSSALREAPPSSAAARPEEEPPPSRPRSLRPSREREADARDGKLRYDDFCLLAREREGGESLSDVELRSRFAALDVDGSGRADLHEYNCYCLREALRHGPTKVRIYRVSLAFHSEAVVS